MSTASFADSVTDRTREIVPAVLIAVALAAAWIPARRAAHLDAMDALRTE